jgi:hypothetical protein
MQRKMGVNPRYKKYLTIKRGSEMNGRRGGKQKEWMGEHMSSK